MCAFLLHEKFYLLQSKKTLQNHFFGYKIKLLSKKILLDYHRPGLPHLSGAKQV